MTPDPTPSIQVDCDDPTSLSTVCLYSVVVDGGSPRRWCYWRLWRDARCAWAHRTQIGGEKYPTTRMPAANRYSRENPRHSRVHYPVVEQFIGNAGERGELERSYQERAHRAQDKRLRGRPAYRDCRSLDCHYHYSSTSRIFYLAPSC